jgi:hypothetical protein
VRVKKLAKEVVSHVVGDRCIRIKVSKKMTAQSQSALYSLLALKPCMVIWMFWAACIWMVAAVCHAAKLLVSLTGFASYSMFQDGSVHTLGHYY